VENGTGPVPTVYEAPEERLRIAQWLDSAAWGAIGPESINTGLGGRETALVNLGQEWAKRGHEVNCFVQRDNPFRIKYSNGGRVEFIPIGAAPAMLGGSYHDAIVSWEDPTIVAKKRIRANCGKFIVGMQVAHLPDLLPEEAEQVDNFVCLSPWAGEFLQLNEPFIKPGTIKAIPNGVYLDRYLNAELDLDMRRKAGIYFWSSSPDRGLHHLLRIWPRVLKEIDSNAVLYVAYGAKKWTSEMKWTHHAQGEVGVLIEEGLNQKNVFDVGKIGQDELAQIQGQASVLPYTCDTLAPTETGCITVTESMAAGAPVMITDVDCLPTEYASASMVIPLDVNDDDWIEGMTALREDPDLYAQLHQAGQDLAATRTWELTSQQWLDLIA
jgi:glycosyltransferase involved in cell wall biosynthesis